MLILTHSYAMRQRELAWLYLLEDHGKSPLLASAPIAHSDLKLARVRLIALFSRHPIETSWPN
jgi:hypothetical protein